MEATEASSVSNSFVLVTPEILIFKLWRNNDSHFLCLYGEQSQILA